MRVCVIDGRGGGLGRRLIQELLPSIGWEHELIALATNRAPAKKLLLPVNGRKDEVAGTDAFTLEKLIHHVIDRVRTVLRAAATV